MDKIITIVGPTASGKTSLAIQLSKELGSEVISLDSRQIYKGMGIGTAQPTIEEMRGVKHHLIGCIHPKEPISAGRYAELVINKVALVQQNGKIPIICGGAGLYYRAIKTGIFRDSTTDVVLRNKLESSYDDDPKLLLKMLEDIDPEYASIVHINNKKRLVRALEIFGTTGKAPSINYQNQKSNPTKVLDLFTIKLDWDRKNLNEHLLAQNYNLIDCQIMNPHLSTLGAYEMPRDEFLDRIEKNNALDTNRGKWLVSTEH